jgi:hypothetical protein
MVEEFLIKNNVKVLNVAGSRASGASGVVEFVTQSLDKALLGG